MSGNVTLRLTTRFWLLCQGPNHVSLRRCYSSKICKEDEFRQEEIDRSKNFLTTLNRKSIPKSFYKLKFSRSSGPGGQNVNKLSTKATLMIEPVFWQSFLPKAISSQLIEKGFKLFNKYKSSIVVSSDLTRSREANVEDCFDKLIAEIKRTVYFRNTENDAENEARWKKIRKKTNEKRLLEKNKNKLKKEARKKPLFM